ncbi:MAG: hypothetical protein ACE145_00570 [Terriglobia bacterium]
MAKKQTKTNPSSENLAISLAASMAPLVAATLAGVIYQARLQNRQSKLNIPESEIVSDVVNLWRTVMGILVVSTK